MICIKVTHGDKNEKKVAYLHTKKECIHWLTLQPGIKTAEIYFDKKNEKNVFLDGKRSVDEWISKNG